VYKGKKLDRRERRRVVREFSLVFSNPFQAVGKIIKTFQNMANDGEFVGVMENLLAKFQPEV